MFIKQEAWGHHASCANKMSRADDPMAVVSYTSHAYGTKNLRVVDASVLPQLPRFVIITSEYMIAVKASDAILVDAKQVSTCTSIGCARANAMNSRLEEV